MNEIADFSEMNLFPIVSLFFLAVGLAGILFFFILNYHFNKFNYERDPKGKWMMGWYLALYLIFATIGIIIVIINS